MFPDLLDGGAWIDSLVTETPRPGQQRDQVRKLTGGFPMGQSTSGNIEWRDTYQQRQIHQAGFEVGRDHSPNVLEDEKKRGGLVVPNMKLYYQAAGLVWVSDWIKNPYERLMKLETAGMMEGLHSHLSIK